MLFLVLFHIQPRMQQQSSISEIRQQIEKQKLVCQSKMEEYHEEKKLLEALERDLQEAEEAQAALAQAQAAFEAEQGRPWQEQLAGIATTVLGDRDLCRASDAL